MFGFLNSRARLAAATLATSLLAALAACGDSTPTAAPVAAPLAAPAASIAVSGTAAVGAPLKDATVSLLCGKGGAPTTAKTLADGSFGMSLDSGCAAPYLLKVTGLDNSTPPVTVTLFAFADAAGNINITPLTDIAAGIVTGGSTSDLYDAVVKQSKKVSDTWTDAAKKDATTKLQDKLKDLGLDGDAAKVTVDLLQGKFKADGKDPLDALLDKLLKARGGVPLASLVEGIVQTGGQPGTTPWNVLFPAGTNSVTLVGTGCYLQYPNPAYLPPVPPDYNSIGASILETALAGSVTVTLTKGTSTLGISANSGTDLFAVTAFAVGGNAGGQFRFTLGQGESGFQGVSASAGIDRSGFGYGTESGIGKKSKSINPRELPKDTSSGINFSISWPSAMPNARSSSNDLSCVTLSPFKPGKFDLPSRVATLVKGTTSAVASPSASPCQSQTYVVAGSTGTTIYGTYSYSVSPAGEVKFNTTTSLNNDFPYGAANNYSEFTQFTQAGEVQRASASVTLDGNSQTGFSLTRTYAVTGGAPASFGSQCYLF